MKKTLLLAAALMVVSTTMASAQRGTLTLGWDNCRVNGGGVSNKTFACDTNSGNGPMLVGGLIPNAATNFNSLNSAFFYVDVFTVSPSLDPWWQYIDGGPGCRPLTAWGLDMGNAAGVNCTRTYWPDVSPPSSAARYFFPTYQANHGTLRMLAAVDAVAASTTPQPATGQETHMFSARLGRQLSTGTGACAGCQTRACLYFARADVFQTNDDNFQIGSATINQTPPSPPNPAVAGPAYVSWQLGTGETACMDPTGARNSTWGSIKSLYR